MFTLSKHLSETTSVKTQSRGDRPGMLSPVGNTAESSWQALLKGQSGISLIDHFDASEFATRFAGLVKDFDPGKRFGINRKEARKMDLFIQYGVAAGVQALDDSGLVITEENAERVGVAIGSGIGGLGLIGTEPQQPRQRRPRKLSPFFVPSTIINMVSGHLSIMKGLQGPNRRHHRLYHGYPCHRHGRPDDRLR